MASIRSVPRHDGVEAFEVRWRVDGEFHQRTFPTYPEAEQYVAELTRQRVGLPRPQPADGPVRFDVIAEAALQTAAIRLKLRTVESYRESLVNHAYPTFGARLITNITPADVEDWILSLVRSGLAPSSVHNHYAALNHVFKYARRRRLVAENPCEHADLPEPDDLFEATILTPHQIDTLADHLDQTPPYGLIVRLTGYTGIRAGEMEALEIGDINLDRGTLRIQRAATHLRGQRIIGTPKSARSIRTIPLRETLVEALGRQVGSNPLRRNTASSLWPGTTRGSHPRPSYRSPFAYNTFYDNHFKPALVELGLPDIRFHDLRHSTAALWLTAGISPYKVSRWLGHANIAITDRIYGHLIPDNQEHDMALIEDYIAQLTTQTEATPTATMPM